MAVPSASYSITIRLEVPADPASVGRLTTAVGSAGGVVTALDVTESHPDRIVLDVTCAASDQEHADRVVAALREVDGVRLGKVSDRTFLLHLGGKIEVRSKVPLRNRDDLSMAYTPGVARVCLAIAEQPDDARRLTVKRNSVAVVTDGSAVLGLGNLGPAAALPVMEGKAALFKRFAGIDAWPICLDTQDVEEIVRTVQLIAPVFGGINLEDIAAPRCFEVERRLRELLDIPVFHDDQHGTAIVVLAALTNALRVVGKQLPEVRVVLSGAGAAGSAIARLLLTAGAGDLVVCDVGGVVHRDRPGLDPNRTWLADHTNPQGLTGSLRAALPGADVFIGVSAPGILDGDDIATMAPGAVVFALANPDPEVDPVAARRTAAVVATGRSDEPNQINNVLAFPGVFRGLLDSGAREVDLAMEAAAARALADVVAPHELNAAFIVPSVFDPEVTAAVAAAVRASVAARGTDRRGPHGVGAERDGTEQHGAERDAVRAPGTIPGMSAPGPVPVPVTGFAHVRLTVTDLARSRAFYDAVFGWEVAYEVPEGADDATREALGFLYGGIIYSWPGGLFGLRPVAPGTDTFSPDRVGLDHLCLSVAGRAELDAAVAVLDALGVEHEPVKDLGAQVVLQFRDPDGIALELGAPAG